MPLYEYACDSCTHAFEALVFNGDTVECPQCKSEKLTRQMSLPGRPKVAESLPTAGGACRSQGPPCGSMCSRFQG